MLDGVFHLPDGTQVVVEGQAQDVVRRIRDVYPEAHVTVGVDPAESDYGQFRVWMPDARGDWHVAATSPHCDERLLQRLVRADPTRGNPYARIMAENLALEAEREAAQHERFEELGDKLHFALMKDLGHLYGGSTRRLHSFAGLRGVA